MKIDWAKAIKSSMYYMSSVTCQIVFTRHLISPEGPDDKARVLAPGEADRAMLLGEHIAKEYLTGTEIELVGVQTNRQRSSLSMDGLLRGINNVMPLKTSRVENLEVAVGENEGPVTVKVGNNELAYGGPKDALSYMVNQMVSAPTCGGHYDDDMINMGRAYAKFLIYTIKYHKPGSLIVVSGHAPSERSHLVEIADCLKADEEKRVRFREIIDFMIANGCSAKGGISCSYIISGSTFGKTMHLVLGDRQSRMHPVSLERLQDAASLYDAERHLAHVR